MISRTDGKGFFGAHWDWLVAGLGLVALGAGIAVLFAALGTDPDEAASEEVASLGRGKASGKIEAVDMTAFTAAKKGLEKPSTVVEPAETQGSFLISGRRVFCEQGDMTAETKACGLPLAFGTKVCPFCGAKQPEEVKVVMDSDGDGIPDDVEKKLGLNPNDASDADGDLDGDGFTNLEEFLAKTDPADPASHPDYLDSVKIVPPLKATYLPFLFERARVTPNGVRMDFKDPKKRNDYGQLGTTYSVLPDQEIGKTGYVAKGYEKKTEKRKIGGANVLKEIDVSIAIVERKSDRKQIELTVNDKRPKAVDVQAKLVYERNGVKEFTVVTGETIDLNGTVYKVVEIKREGKAAKVTLENGGVKKTLEALEQ